MNVDIQVIGNDENEGTEKAVVYFDRDNEKTSIKIRIGSEARSFSRDEVIEFKETLERASHFLA